MEENMRDSKIAVFTCFLVCTIALGGFVCSALAQTAARVQVFPNIASVIIGQTQQFRYQVFDKHGNKMNAQVEWSVSTAAAADGCTIYQNGLLTVASTASVGKFRNGVVATVVGEQVAGRVILNVIDTPFKGGNFAGTYVSNNGNNGYVAMNLSANSGTALVIVITPTLEYFEFPIVLATGGTLSGTSHTNYSGGHAYYVTVKGQLDYTAGVATSVSGTYAVINAKNGKTVTVDSGDWTAGLCSPGGFGGKVGYFWIPPTTSPKAGGITGYLAAIFQDDGSIVGLAQQVAATPPPAVPFNSGTYDPDTTQVNFNVGIGGTASNACNSGVGGYDTAQKKWTGQLYNLFQDDVGHWQLLDLAK
jgi:hypothetical protein